jgi:RNA methyltransferase, TrmH family
MYSKFKKFQYFCFVKRIKMLSKSKIKSIRSLEQKKYRNELNAFVAEGNKLVADMMHAFECELILAKSSWMATQGHIPAKELLVAEEDDIPKASFLKSPQDVLAVFKRPEWQLADVNPATSLVLALDGIQDPGNLGTIIRLADWFGIEHIVCSSDTADVFGPKTVQATMGALVHVKVHYTDLHTYLQDQVAQGTPLYGTFLDGENMYTKTLTANGILVMGNEGNGIRPEIEALINQKLYIPSFPAERETSESLNVAIATAVVCAEFRRRQGNVAQ